MGDKAKEAVDPPPPKPPAEDEFASDKSHNTAQNPDAQ